MPTNLRRVESDQPFTLSVVLYPQDSETPADPDANVVMVTVTHVNGTLIQASASASRTGQGAYSYTLPAQAVPLNAYVVWRYTVNGSAAQQTTYLTVMGSHYIDLATVRALDGLSDTNAYPTALLVEKRDEAEVLFDVATGSYWTQRYCMDILDGDPNYRRALQSAIMDVIDYIPYKRLMVKTRNTIQLLSMELNGTPVPNVGASGVLTGVTASSITDSGATRTVNEDAGLIMSASNVAGQITPSTLTQATVQSNGATSWAVTSPAGWSNGTPVVGSAYTMPSQLQQGYTLYSTGEIEANLGWAAFPRGISNVQVEYLAGRQYMPADLTNMLGRYIRYLCLETNARVPDRATAMTTEFGTFRIGQASAWDNPTGIAEIDAVLERYGEREPVFA